MKRSDHIATFEEARPALLGLAYRILGSRADAEDAVQDTFLKWQAADRASILSPLAWLKAICTRRSIDLLRSAHRARVSYVGAWLPEPIHTVADEADAGGLATSLTTAFLLMLERLTPKERAAYLLHDIFEQPYPEIAATLDLNEAACRQLVSRARSHIDRAQVRHMTPIDRQEELLSTFQSAIVSGDTASLAAMLSDDIGVSHDSGGKVPAALHHLAGKAAVLDFIRSTVRPFWAAYEWQASDLNGQRGVVLRKDGDVVAALTFAYDGEGKVTDIFIVRNPEKLARLEGSAIA